MKKQYLLLLAGLSLFSCKKEIETSVNERPITLQETIASKEKSKETFSKALAKALEKEPLLREFLKTEALKQFDKDNDVLYLMVKDFVLSDSETVEEKVLKYGLSSEDMNVVLNDLPTLTIMVPKVPNFSPVSWNTSSEIPQVAVDPNNRNEDVKLYDAKAQVTLVPVGTVPGFPVVVVKENERVNARINNIDKSPKSAILLQSNSGLGAKANNDLEFYNHNGVQFAFSNKAFDGRITTKRNTLAVTGAAISRSVQVNTTTNPLDPKVIAAYNNQVEWQRDYIYYGINPAAGVTRGKFDTRFKEYITSIRMNMPDYTKIGDQAEDPVPTKTPYAYQGTTPPTQAARWTDGYFDIRVSILINSTTGAGEVLNKSFSIEPERLFTVNYERIGTSALYTYAGVTAIDCFVNEPIDGWNLQSYGSTWKFTVSEYDLTNESTVVKSNKSTFGSNFEVNVPTGEVFKVGGKFGGSTTFESTATYTYQSTAGTDDLGEGVLNFGDPIVTGTESVTDTRGQTRTYHKTWEVSCGSAYLCVEPRQVFF